MLLVLWKERRNWPKMSSCSNTRIRNSLNIWTFSRFVSFCVGIIWRIFRLLVWEMLLWNLHPKNFRGGVKSIWAKTNTGIHWRLCASWLVSLSFKSLLESIREQVFYQFQDMGFCRYPGCIFYDQWGTWYFVKMVLQRPS